MRFVSRLVPILVLMPLALSVHAANNPLANPTSTEFCQAVQRIMASTDRAGEVKLFTDMPEYRHSKPSVNPHNIYQVVSYDGQLPIMVSCKIKGAAHLRSAYGDDAAGEQLFCPEIARRVKTQAIDELTKEGDAAAAAATEAFVIDDNEPFMTGRDYLSDFELSYRDDDGAVHFNTPGLFHDYDSWTTWILPENFEGQAYCHIATVAYMKGVAKGEIEPGTLMTTADDAPVTPH
ncbi:MAG TPA: hypothetical protein QF499_04330 [Gammaproteobacteria bacterium]|nr:hypothetical protein [Gammaproteobacteria bacterium]MDP7296673.1 hypothetical protein [Gammaproteobacteria bacterium]HJP38345.1 hypothetical protein [Gammaproteobacteria bacterium]